MYKYPDIVIYDDGHFYSCINHDGVIGEPPNISNDWVRFYNPDTFWELDDESDLTPTREGRGGNRWILDEDGDIMPHPDLNFEPARNIVPRENESASLGKAGKRWEEMHGREGYFNKIYGDFNGTIDKKTIGTHLAEAVKNLVGMPSWDDTNYVITFTTRDGVTFSIDLPLEQLKAGIDFSKA
jgi:hypothetical protein